MADTAFQTQYRQEFVAGFEQRQSILRDTVTSEAQIKGNSAVFLVADSGSATAQTRGVNGLIPARADNLTQNTCTLTEWNDLVRKTQFNIFASQGNQRDIMQQTSMGVINRKIDEQIITELSTATVVANSVAVTGSVELILKGQAILGAAKVPWDGGITLLASSALLAYLMQAPEFAKAEYVNMRPWVGSEASWRDTPAAYRWLNMLVIVHPALSLNTSAEVCYMYHRSAIGHAINTAGIDAQVGYVGEQDYSWARTSVFSGAKLLQNSGVVKFNHDGSAMAAS